MARPLTRLLARLRRSERGAAAIEFVLVAPALVLMIVGIAQLGILFMANAGLRNAVAEGARYATIYVPETGRPTDAQISARIASAEFGLEAENLDDPVIVHGVDAGANFVDISVSYDVPLDFIFFAMDPVTLTETRRAYINPAPPA